MEKLYNPQHFHCTENINLKKYFDEYSDHLLDEQKTRDTLNNKILSFLDDDELTNDHLKELNSICSINHLTVPDEQKHIDLKYMRGLKAAAVHHHAGEITDEALCLHTVRRLDERKKAKNSRRLFKELRERTVHVRNSVPEEEGKPNLKLGETVVISIRFFRPFEYHYSEPISFDAFRFDQEITLLGENTLADLRDKIRCNSDETVFEEVDGNLTQTNFAQTAKDIYPSGFLFIDDVFYNDFRSKDAIDYSEVIRTWATNKEIGNFQTAEMDKTTLISLSPRFGYPYVYQHQGSCEHIFIFAHARLISDTDPLRKNCYPFHSDIGKGRVVYCFICGLSLPTCIIVGFDRLPQKNTPMCNDCCISYCYIDGEKIGNFKVYRYVDRNAMF